MLAASSWDNLLVARAQSLATALVLESIDMVDAILSDYGHRFAEHDAFCSAPVSQHVR
jgi:hypothetical protein